MYENDLTYSKQPLVVGFTCLGVRNKVNGSILVTDGAKDSTNNCLIHYSQVGHTHCDMGGCGTYWVYKNQISCSGTLRSDGIVAPKSYHPLFRMSMLAK